MSVPLLLDERARLEAVRALDMLWTPSEERFDRITRMATRVLSVPVALVNLVDADEQFTKSCIGLDLGDSMPRSQSICSTALGQDEPLVVPDLRADARFADLPYVRGGPRLRAYAGQALRVRGQRVGTLCVMDVRPRTLTEAELAGLVDLAHWAESELRSDDEHRVARELDQLQRRSSLILQSVAEGVVGVDCEGDVTFVNDAAAQVLGWSPEDLVGRNLHATVHSRREDGSPLPEADCEVTAVLRHGGALAGLEGVFWRRDAGPVPVDWSVGALAEGDEVRGAVVVFEDVTRRVEVERMKEEFTAVVSHELRTPLTSLKGAVDLLAGGAAGPVAPAQARLVDMARRNADRLARLVDDILDVERLARGRMPISRGRLRVQDLVTAAAATVQGAAERSGVALVVEPVDAEVWGDEHRLLQVLTNLLGNALRFTEPGGSVRLWGEVDPAWVAVAVSDTGVGIPPESRDRVFDRFWQVDASDRRARGGTGLGLAIAKSIVEAHGGRIELDSEVGRGSTFTVRLPRRWHQVPVPVERRRSAS